jgi:hypothetical protein
MDRYYIHEHKLNVNPTHLQTVLTQAQAQQVLAQQLEQANQQINAFQAAQAAVQAAQVAPGGAPAMVPVIAQPVVFALSPGMAIGLGRNNLID